MSSDDQTAELSLYERLGGYDVIASIIDKLFALMRADARFSRFGAGRSLDSRKWAQQLTVDQICSLSGGPCYYMGRDMKTSHAGLRITEEEWQANLEFTTRSLQNHGVAEREQVEFLLIFERYKNEIVEG